MKQSDLHDLLIKDFDYYKEGKNAQYIPALSQVDPKQLGIALYNLQANELQTCGIPEKSANVRFAIESISKVPVLLLAINDNGLDGVFSHVDAEPTGFSFNSLLNMQIEQRKYPLNPFVNQGAIVVNSLLKGKNSDERFARILDFMKEIFNDNDITLNEEVYHSESKTGDINRSIAYYMKGNGIWNGDVEDVLDSYFKQCSVNVNAIDLANLGALLANGGVAPWNGKRIVSEESATIVKSLMLTAGLYDESGDFSMRVGVPTKSGVGGGLMSAVPGKYGIGIFSPAIDKPGNSVAGMKLLHDVVQELNIDIFA
ncbi:MAG: glutaminase A [Candidatus Paralactobacillus gallistercoris]|uniref:Glutaminase n=1 Tax=Candidatus Paralactobacillus gallistercoris TaxID=2838724 RepID=A0A948TKC0_9LACO|nr:glutaminase A [Candidatus Paralactobacillus gallistercoris]